MEIEEIFKFEKITSSGILDNRKVAKIIADNFNVGLTVDFNNIHTYGTKAIFVANLENELINFKTFKNDILVLLHKMINQNQEKEIFINFQMKEIIEKLSMMVQFYRKEEFPKKYHGKFRYLQQLK